MSVERKKPQPTCQQSYPRNLSNDQDHSVKKRKYCFLLECRSLKLILHTGFSNISKSYSMFEIHPYNYKPV